MACALDKLWPWSRHRSYKAGLVEAAQMFVERAPVVISLKMEEILPYQLQKKN